jgi:hypothetical protein
MVSDAVAENLARCWLEGWNGEDVDTIMSPFAAEVIFSSPFVPRLTGDPSRTEIEGRDALAAYVSDALAR